jgi:hypothetical protein
MPKSKEVDEINVAEAYSQEGKDIEINSAKLLGVTKILRL